MSDPYEYEFEPIAFRVRHDFGMMVGHGDAMALPKGWRARLRAMWRIIVRDSPYGITDRETGRFLCLLLGRHARVWARGGRVSCSRCGAQDRSSLVMAHFSGVV